MADNSLWSGRVLRGTPGNDVIPGTDADERLFGEEGNDQLFGGGGNDVLVGGSGDDELTSGSGHDLLVFDPSNPDEGHDVIKDLEIGSDKIVLSAEDIYRAAPAIVEASGDPTALDPTDFDASPDWLIEESASGNAVVVHPGGTIEVEGLPFSDSLTFADLLPALQLINLISGTDGNDHLRGTYRDELIQGLDGNDTLEGRNGDDVLLGGEGNDTLYGGNGDDDLVGNGGDDVLKGGSGDDTLTSGTGRDEYLFDPSNSEEGHDVITDLELGKDKIVLHAADILNASPNVVEASGDESALEATDFDPSSDWQLRASASGNVVVVHPGGTIEIEGVPFSDSLTFADLLPALEIRGLVSGDAGDNHLNGSNKDDVVQGLDGNDQLNGRGGADIVSGGDGDDTIYGGWGKDTIVGGSDDDHLYGNGGSDTFRFDPSNADEGHDVIRDFAVGHDQILLNAADVYRADNDIVGGNGALDPAVDFDADDDWTLSGATDGDLLIGHPGGTIEVDGVKFGDATDTFVELVGLGALGLEGLIDGSDSENELLGSNIDELIQGRGGSDALFGGNGNDVLLGGDGDDILTGGSDDDILTGGEGADRFAFDPSNDFEGDDRITDFNAAEDLVSLKLDDILDADPSLPNPPSFSDLDDSPNWDVQDAGDGDVLVVHPGGTIEFDGVPFGSELGQFDSFEDLSPVIEVM